MIPLTKVEEEGERVRNQKENQKILLRRILFSVVFLVLVCVIIGVWWYSTEFIEHRFSKHEERGTFGDQFGAINSLFSGLALAGIIITILLQSRELSLQRKELSQTREVFNQQKFETTFFQLLNLIERNHRSLEFNQTTRKGQEIVEKKTFRGSEALFSHYKYFFLNKLNFKEETLQRDITRQSELFFESLKDDILPYIKAVENTLNFIYLSKVENKRFYKDLLASQLTETNKVVIAHYCLLKENFKFKVQCKDSEILVGANSVELFKDENHKYLYELTTKNEYPK